MRIWIRDQPSDSGSLLKILLLHPMQSLGLSTRRYLVIAPAWTNTFRRMEMAMSQRPLPLRIPRRLTTPQYSLKSLH
jgi:hypothetical protein